jgi:hypothetical protein
MTVQIAIVGTINTQQMLLRARDLAKRIGRSSDLRTTRNPRSR